MRSLDKDDRFYQRENAPGDAPYWRGYIWMPINYLALQALHTYAAGGGPHADRCQVRGVYTSMSKLSHGSGTGPICGADQG